MEIIYIILFLITASGGYAFTQHALRKKKAIAGNKAVKMSQPSKQILREYNALPKDSRPFKNIERELLALDAHTDVYSIQRRRHFNENYLPYTRVEQGFKFGWKPFRQSCSHRTCRFKDYYALHCAIQGVRQAIEDKEAALRLAEFNSQARDALNELESRLRQEESIQRQIAQELKNA